LRRARQLPAVAVLFLYAVLGVGCAGPRLARPVSPAVDPVRFSAGTLSFLNAQSRCGVAALDADQLARLEQVWTAGDLEASLALAEGYLAESLSSLDLVLRREHALESCVMARHAIVFASREANEELRAIEIHNRALANLLRCSMPLLEFPDPAIPQPGGKLGASEPKIIATLLPSRPMATVLGVPMDWPVILELPALAKIGFSQTVVEKLELAAEYELQEALRGEPRKRALGVPMIATRVETDGSSADGEIVNMKERYYPDEICFPLTAFLEEAESDRPGVLDLRFVSPYRTREVLVGGRALPLAEDLFTPLAVFIDSKLAGTGLIDVGIQWFIRPGGARAIEGLYLIEPHAPSKIPVIFVHGIASSPYTWIRTHRALIDQPTIRDHYQFLYFLYVTPNSYVDSAYQLRKQIEAYDEAVNRHPVERAAEHQRILVGHSMGGLLSALQTIELASEEGGARVDEEWEFHPDPRIPRIITIATPYGGSPYASGFLRRLAAFLTAPLKIQNALTLGLGLAEDLDTNSVDLLGPDSPVLARIRQAMLDRKLSGMRRTLYHGIYGEVDPARPEKGDGFVPLASASLEAFDTRMSVKASHTEIHGHEQTIAELVRILEEHWETLGHH